MPLDPLRAVAARAVVAALLIAQAAGASIAQAAGASIAQAAGALATDQIKPWQETVALEHQDRRTRLDRLSRQLLRDAPILFEYAMPAAALPTAFGVDIPILRSVFRQRVFFDTDQDEIRPEAEAELDVVAETLRRDAPDTQVFVAGHTDGRGTDAYNYALSARRAQNVAWALARRGVAQAKIWWVPFGEAIPLYPNTTDENMARNRRVEFIFGAKVEAVALWLSWQRRLICVGASPLERAECDRGFSALPQVEAIPIARDAPAPPRPAPTSGLPTIDTRDLAPVTPVPGAPANEERAVVTLPRNAPVVIDLRQERVLVDRLYR